MAPQTALAAPSTPVALRIRVGNAHLDTADQVVAAIGRLGLTQRSAALSDVLDQLGAFYERANDITFEFLDVLERSNVLNHMMNLASPSASGHTWADLRAHRRRFRSQDARIKGTLNTIAKSIGEHNLERLTRALRATEWPHHRWNSIPNILRAQLSNPAMWNERNSGKDIDISQTVWAIQYQTFLRNTTSSSGSRKGLQIEQIDIDKATNLFKNLRDSQVALPPAATSPLPADKLQILGARLTETGQLVLAGETQPSSTPPSPAAQQSLTQPQPRQPHSGQQPSSQQPPPTPHGLLARRTRSQTAAQAPTAPSAQRNLSPNSNRSSNDVSELESVAQADTDQRARLVYTAMEAGMGTSGQGLEEALEASTLRRLSTRTTRRYRDDIELPRQVIAQSVRETTIPADEGLPAATYGCDDVVPQSLITVMNAKPGLQNKALWRVLTQVQHLVRHKSGDKGIRIICHAHWRLLAKYCGLQNRPSSDVLVSRIQQVYTNRNDLFSLKTGQHTHKWFTRAGRPFIPSDALKVFNFFPGPQANAFVPQITNAHRALLLTSQQYQHYTTRGSITMPLFTWLLDETPPRGQVRVWDLMLEEIEMYRWHLRENNGIKNVGWLKNCIHSITQSIIRTDPEYYDLYVTLREDHAFRLISYPYYCKMAEPGESTAFRHLDLNIPDLVHQGRGKNQIQGSVSLVDEVGVGCTELIPGMHRFLGKWWQDIEARAQAQNRNLPDGWIHDIQPWMWTQDDARQYNTDWTEERCLAGEVRVSKPHLAHGSTGPQEKTRITVLPWYVAIQADHQQLEIPEAGDWAELSACHIQQATPKKTPSGLGSVMEAPGRFPAAPDFEPGTYIGQAILGKMSYNSASVKRELAILLGVDKRARQEYINQNRTYVLAEARMRFGELRLFEQEIYGNKSFFYAKDRGWASGPHRRHPGADYRAPEPDDELDEEGTPTPSPSPSPSRTPANRGPSLALASPSSTGSSITPVRPSSSRTGLTPGVASSLVLYNHPPNAPATPTPAGRHPPPPAPGQRQLRSRGHQRSNTTG